MPVSNPSGETTPINKTSFSPTLSICKWPSKEVLAGEPLFTTFLNDADLEALHETAGLGHLGWWLDPECANGKLLSPNDEEEISMIAWAREPFERAGEIRDASRCLLDRLNELERLHNLADERARSKPPLAYRRKKSNENGGVLSNIYHSTLSLASEVFTEDGVPLPKQSSQLPISPSGRKDTYMVRNNRRTNDNQLVPPKVPLTSSPKLNRGGNLANKIIPPRFCKSPERNNSTSSLRPSDQRLQRTYSKNSLNMLAENSPDIQQRNNNAADYADNDDENRSCLSHKLGRTYDAEEMSDVFISPHASLENFNSHGAPPVTPSANLPQPGGRKALLTYNANRGSGSILNRSSESPVLDIARQQEANLRASVSRHSLRGSNEGTAAGTNNLGRRSENRVPPTLRVARDSPVRSVNLATIPASPLDAAHHKISAPCVLTASANEMRTSLPTMQSSGSNSAINSFSAALDLAKQQEANLRASSGGKKHLNNSLTNSLDGGSNDRLNQSLPVDDRAGQEGIVGMFLRHVPQEHGIKQTNHVDRKRAGKLPVVRSAGDLTAAKEHSTSQTSLGRISSDQLQDIIRQQEQSLKASGEEALRKVRSKNSLGKSMESVPNANSHCSDSDVALPPPEPEPSEATPSRYNNELNIIDPLKLAEQQHASLRVSGDTYHVSQSALKTSSNFTPPVRQSASPVNMRKTSKIIPPPLTLPIDIEEKIFLTHKFTPNSAATIRPGSYADQLQNPENPGSAIEAWVTDTLAVAPDDMLKLSVDSLTVTMDGDGVTDSADTEAILSGDSVTIRQELQPIKGVTSSMRPPISSNYLQPKLRLVKAPSNLVNSENIAPVSAPIRSKLRLPTAVGLAPSAAIRTRIIAPTAIRARGRPPITTVSAPRGVPVKPMPPRGVVQKPHIQSGVPMPTIPARLRVAPQRVPVSGLPSSRLSSAAATVRATPGASTSTTKGAATGGRGRMIRPPL